MLADFLPFPHLQLVPRCDDCILRPLPSPCARQPSPPVQDLFKLRAAEAARADAEAAVATGEDERRGRHELRLVTEYYDHDCYCYCSYYDY